MRANAVGIAVSTSNNHIKSLYSDPVQPNPREIRSCAPLLIFRINPVSVTKKTCRSVNSFNKFADMDGYGHSFTCIIMKVKLNITEQYP